MERDFNTRLIMKVNWSEIVFDYNTGKKYQHKQDLVALFWNSYVYYEDKIRGYAKEFDTIPYDVLNEMIFDFRQNFPKDNRVEGVNYFDDLLSQLINKYKQIEELNKPGFPYNNPLLIKSYLDNKLSEFLTKAKENNKDTYRENFQIEEFKKDEIKETQEIIEYFKEQINKGMKSKIKFLQIRKQYLDYVINGYIINNKPKKVTYPMVRRFCELCNISKLHPYGNAKSDSDYTKSICDQYGLDWKDNIRQNFEKNHKPTKNDAFIKQVIEIILPTIPEKDSKHIIDFINKELLK